jgi:hypothetical protein
VTQRRTAKTKNKMPPKGKDTKKLIEDKTFGMKNKNKSSKAQKYMQQLESQLKNDQKRKVIIRIIH